jgi:predicted membrane-bound spermidine synthase
VYQVVWVRMAYTSFGVTTPVLSVVISVFMLGLSVGSWLGGRSIARLTKLTGKTSLIFYGATEALIGLGAFLVPLLFSAGESFLLSAGEMNSSRYLLMSALVVGGSLVPWCVLMGFTFPFMMSFVRETGQGSPTSFSRLYMANVLGAVCGTVISAVAMIELFGFYRTLMIAALLNFLVAGGSVLVSRRAPAGEKKAAAAEPETAAENTPTGWTAGTGFVYLMLFFTGFASMSMEVVWIRGFTRVLQTRTYSFAGLLAVYLLATWLGSAVYRRHLARGQVLATELLLGGLAVFALLPVVLNDPRVLVGIPTVLGSIVPFCATLGYLTPFLIDRHSAGRPDRAGSAYAINVFGCILGPLAAAYLLLPGLGIRKSLIVLSIPFLLFFLAAAGRAVWRKGWVPATAVVVLLLLLRAGLVNATYDEVYALTPGAVVRTDHTATVISIGKGPEKRLLVNGVAMTSLGPPTKVMAHLPLILTGNQPESGLAICLGMGTTYRSLLSWNIDTTAVELVPSVKDAMGYYFDDAEEVASGPRGRIFIDDGRRFLRRTTQRFDVITIDPPPPVETAGSSLLYSEEFYDLVKSRLKEGGILQQWFPFGERKILQAVARSLSNKFPHVKVYKSVQGWGHHFVASMSPIETPTVGATLARLPASAQADLLEWTPSVNVVDVIRRILSTELPLADLLVDDPAVVVTDDRPFNEYYILRRLQDWRRGTYETIH